MRALFFALIFISSSAAAQENCVESELDTITPEVAELRNLSNKMACVATKQYYQCQKLEDRLSSEDKKKIIQCDQNDQHFVGFMDSLKAINSCNWKGIKLFENRFNKISELPGIIAESMMQDFRRNKLCNSDVTRKRQLLNIFNTTMPDKRFKLEESFFGNRFHEMNCTEIERLLRARYNNYLQVIDREMRAAALTGKRYKIPEEFRKEDILQHLNELIDRTKTFYHCYTPRAKTEMICNAISEFLTEVILVPSPSGSIKNLPLTLNSKTALTRFSQDSKYKKIDYVNKRVSGKHVVEIRGEHFSVHSTKIISGPAKKNIQKTLQAINNLTPGEVRSGLTINEIDNIRIIRGTLPKIAVIGRDQSRVLKVQLSMPVETFTPSKAAMEMVRTKNDISLLLRENTLWMQSVKERGLTVLDLGLGDAKDYGEFYKMEHTLVNQYIEELKAMKKKDLLQGP